MARIRTIKPEFWHDEKLAPCDPLTRLVFLGLISAADDFGRVLDNERVLDAFIFPETGDSVREPLANLSRMGRVRRGKTASGQRIVEIVNWERHQKVDKPQPKMAFPEIVEDTTVTDVRESVANQSRTVRESVAPHTTDLHTTDLHTTDHVQRAKRARRAPGVVSEESKYPDFSHEARAACLDVWKAKLGLVNAGQLLAMLGPMFRPTDDAFHVPHAAIVRGVRDYCGIVTKGRSAPFMGVADLGKKLGALAENAKRYHDDPAARTDGAMLIVHGTTRAAA